MARPEGPAPMIATENVPGTPKALIRFCKRAPRIEFAHVRAPVLGRNKNKAFPASQKKKAELTFSYQHEAAACGNFGSVCAGISGHRIQFGRSPF